MLKLHIISLSGYVPEVFCIYNPVNRYNFLDKSVGFSSLFEMNRESLVDNESQIVETQQPLSVPGIEGVHIPSKIRGRVLRLIDGTSALVRWEVNNEMTFSFHNLYLFGCSFVTITSKSILYSLNSGHSYCCICSSSWRYYVLVYV